ncbi:odorant receptor 4-like isoform X2 [Pieris brassicae]|uniref:odorant receptor 4-like isoform X2 n=1 Tax=Pieris brassicae TaxID=7116 RepID=UPI001E65F68E|nr:odorant receptor 4-like isoform X2 [Pieris brassicae]
MERLPEDVIKPLRLSIDILGRSNIYIWNNDSMRNKIRVVYMMVLFIVFFISVALYTIQIFSEEVPISEVAFQISTFLFLIHATCKAILILRNRTNIVTLIEKIGDTWRIYNINEQQIRNKEFLFQRLNFCLKVYYTGSMITVWTNAFAPIIIYLGKLAMGQNINPLLPFGCVIPFDPLKDWFRYILAYVFEMYARTEILMVTLCALLSVEFAILKVDITLVKPDNSSIKSLVRKHQQLLVYIGLLDKIFNKIIFLDLLFVTVVMCLCGFAVTMANNVVDCVKNVLCVLSLLVPVYIFCYFSEQLKQECADIAQAAYNSKWYNVSVSYKRIICFIITRAQKPCCLTSLQYVPITLNTFFKVVSTSWSYYSVIRTVYGDK